MACTGDFLLGLVHSSRGRSWYVHIAIKNVKNFSALFDDNSHILTP